MAIKKSIARLFLVLTGLLSLQFQCNKRFGCTETVYNFAIGIKAYPDKDSINVGDTIWLQVNEQTKLNDLQTGKMIDYSNAANLGSAIGFQSFSIGGGQFTIPSAQKFNFLIVQGMETANANPALYHEYLFAEANNRYTFQLGVIPKEKGLFRLVFINAANVYRKNDKCTKANFTLNFKNTNQHYYLHPSYQGGTFVGGDYYFKVY